MALSKIPAGARAKRGSSELDLYDEHPLIKRLDERHRQLVEELTSVKRLVEERFVQVVEATRSSGSTREHQEWLKQHGRNRAEHEDVYQLSLPLDITTFLEERLEPENHYVINAIKPPFAQRVKQRRLDQYEQHGTPFWIHRSQGEWRLAYTEQDRDGVMQPVWEEAETQAYIQKQLGLQRPAEHRGAWRQTQRRGGRRQGPYARPVPGSSSEVRQQSLHAFFRSAESAA